jgi:hypothetical protein
MLLIGARDQLRASMRTEPNSATLWAHRHEPLVATTRLPTTYLLLGPAGRPAGKGPLQAWQEQNPDGPPAVLPDDCL